MFIQIVEYYKDAYGRENMQPKSVNVLEIESIRALDKRAFQDKDKYYTRIIMKGQKSHYDVAGDVSEIERRVENIYTELQAKIISKAESLKMKNLNIREKK